MRAVEVEMALARFVAVMGVAVVAVGLLTGVLQLFSEQTDGSAKFAPHLSRGALGWYRTRTVAAIGPDRVLAVKSSVSKLFE